MKNVEKISTVREHNGSDIKKDDSFEAVLAAERKRINANTAKDNKAHGSAESLYANGMNYYNNQAKAAYFYMMPSTTDFKG